MLAPLLPIFAASVLATANPADVADAQADHGASSSPHRISIATGVGPMLNDVDEDGHGSTGGIAMGVRLGYDHTLGRHFDLGAGFEYAHVDARASHVFLPSVRARAHLGNEWFEIGLSIKAMMLASVMTGAQDYPSTATHTNTWTGVAGGAALDLRAWIGDTAIELAPEIDVGTAHGDARGWYVSNDLAHASIMVWLGAVRRF